MRKGLVFVSFMAWLVNRVAQPPSGYAHNDNVHGDPASLSDARLKEEVTSVSGAQALSVLSQIQGCTYERPDLQERRLGLIADEVGRQCRLVGGRCPRLHRRCSAVELYKAHRLRVVTQHRNNVSARAVGKRHGPAVGGESDARTPG